MGRGRAAVTAIAFGVITLVAGCGSETKTVTETVEAGQATVESTTGSESSTPSTGAEIGSLGDTQTITTDGVELEATVRDLENPAETDTTPEDIDRPGHYWVRVTATLSNKGSEPLEDFGASFQLVDSKGQRVFGNDVVPVGPAPQLSGALLPGDKQTGAVVFLVPNGAQPREIRLTVFSAAGPPARWSVD